MENRPVLRPPQLVQPQPGVHAPDVEGDGDVVRERRRGDAEERDGRLDEQPDELQGEADGHPERHGETVQHLGQHRGHIREVVPGARPRQVVPQKQVKLLSFIGGFMSEQAVNWLVYKS